MAGHAYATLVGTRRERAPRAPGGPRRAGVVWPLATVGAVFTAAQLLLVRPGLGLGWDETVYVSQVSGHAPAAFFSAPRARGVSLLVAPVASWSSSTPLLRVYLALLSGLALYLALRAWRPLFPVRVLTLAGTLFASLWITLFYGPQAMPNYWVAIGALTATACTLRAVTAPSDRTALWGLAASGALMAWMRPMDAALAALPLLVLVLLRRRWTVLAVLLGGLAAGAVEWVVEAYTAYGGLLNRLSDGSDIQGGLGWHLAVADQLRSLGGRTLCRPCTGTLPGPAVTLWWFALPLLALLGLAVAVRARRAAATLLPLASAVMAAFPYLFMIGYAAPRFLLPAYALLAIPVADALCRLTTTPGGARRPVATTLAVLALAAHLTVQLTVLLPLVDRTAAAHRDWSRTAATLHRLGVREPCLLTGHEAIPVAFYAGCSSAATTGHNANSTSTAIARTARHRPVATLVAPGDRLPDYARTWPSVRLGELRLYYAVPEGP
ncbi:hypothetical protein [Streptomyces sp. NPDC047028]|uniref:hypothetical protein n=1 Tax=Streptomyces sp. NPDC047028 TaxID=3155793 RepID=UPI0033D0F456